MRAWSFAWWVVLICVATAKSAEKAEFSGEKAFAYVKRLVDFGPRPPGSVAIEKARGYISETLKSFGWTVTEQAFTESTPRGEVRFVNLIARFGGSENQSFFLCSHYDTKTFETIRFVGANDGGSSSGLLLETARVLAAQPQLAVKTELVFFDGEEAYENFTDADGLYGSRHFASQLAQTGKAKNFRGGILFDMVGKREVEITLPPDSPSQIARDIFLSADALKTRNHFTYFDSTIIDDHTPLNRVGIPVIDLIDFHFPSWHTAEDTIDKLSPESLQIVGSVAVYYLSHFALK